MRHLISKTLSVEWPGTSQMLDSPMVFNLILPLLTDLQLTFRGKIEAIPRDLDSLRDMVYRTEMSNTLSCLVLLAFDTVNYGQTIGFEDWRQCYTGSSSFLTAVTTVRRLWILSHLCGFCIVETHRGQSSPQFDAIQDSHPTIWSLLSSIC